MTIVATSLAKRAKADSNALNTLFALIPPRMEKGGRFSKSPRRPEGFHLLNKGPEKGYVKFSSAPVPLVKAPG